MKNLTILSILFTAFTLTAAEYDIDKSHSRVGFSVKHMVISTVRGDFNEYSGIVLFDENDVSKSKVEGTVQVASINTDNEQRDNHLKNADFFDVENYPVIKFVSTKVTQKDDQYIMTGDLTIRDVTKSVEIPFNVTGVLTDPWGNDRVGIEAEFKINRKDFGVAWSKTMDNGGLVVSDDVKIELFFEGIKKK